MWLSMASSSGEDVPHGLEFLFSRHRLNVAISRAHWAKGFWNSKGGIEFPFTLGAVAAINGIAEPGAYSLDRALGLPAMGTGVYVTVLVVGVVAYLVGARALGPEPAKANRAA